MGYCKTTLHVRARLKQENTLRPAHAHTHTPEPAQTETPGKTVMFLLALFLNHKRPVQ